MLLVKARGRRRLRRIAAVLIAGGCVTFTVNPPAAADSGEVYLQAHASTQARVHDLLRRMTVNEKGGQLEQIALTRIEGDCNWRGGAPTEPRMPQVLATERTGASLA